MEERDKLFTPGPWAAQILADQWSDIIVRSKAETNEDELIVTIDPGFWDTEDRPEVEANAHLIAAAPDLFEALKRSLDMLRSISLWDNIQDTQDQIESQIKKIEAILDKARGEQS